MRIVSISALNIVMSMPHSSERYVQLFQKAYKKKLPINIRGEFVGVLGSCRLEEVDGRQIVVGELYKYFELKMDSQWYNTLENKAADDDELSKIIIPGHLKPHFEVSPFVFFPHKHRIFFISREVDGTFTPNQAHKLFDALFNSQPLVGEFGSIGITIEPSIDSLSQILGISKMKMLHIEVTPPNPDDQDLMERRLYKKMRLRGADKQIIELHSDQHSGLQLDEDLKSLAKIAQSNGSVSGRGEDEVGRSTSLSTLSHPLQEKTIYDPKIQRRLPMLIGKALELLPKIAVRD